VVVNKRKNNSPKTEIIKYEIANRLGSLDIVKAINNNEVTKATEFSISSSPITYHQLYGIKNYVSKKI
jgi:hypothetical protein